MKKYFIFGSLFLWYFGAFSLIGEAAPLTESQLNDSLMKIHFQNQENVWKHQQDKLEKQRSFQAAIERKIASDQAIATSHQDALIAEKILKTKYIQKWLWAFLALAVVILFLAYLFWKRLQYRFQEYHELREEAERTYDLVKENHQWRKHLETGNTYLDHEEFGAAITTFEEALFFAKSEAEKAETCHHLGIAYWQLYLSHKSDHVDALFKAAEYLGEVERHDPGNKELVLDNNSWLISIYRHLKQIDKAIRTTEKSIVLARELKQEIKVKKLQHVMDALEATKVAQSKTAKNSNTFSDPLFEGGDKYKTLYPNQSEVFS